MKIRIEKVIKREKLVILKEITNNNNLNNIYKKRYR